MSAEISPVATRPLQADGPPRAIVLPSLAVILLIATLLIRLPSFGDPNYHVDESFYLLFGERMQAGAIPYQDVWDRKPAGLFVLYWIFAALGGLIPVHLAAMLVSWGTALCIARIAQTLAGGLAAGLAGIAYLAMQQVFHGGGGQAPVFYNCLMAAAALLTLRRLLGHSGLQAAYGAMLLCGLSLTIKPTTLFEGGLFGICLVLCRYKDTANLSAAARHASALMLIAAAPTLVILAAFAATGHLATYWFATIQSIFLVTPPPLEVQIGRTLQMALLSGLLLFCAAAGVLSRFRQHRGERVALTFLAAWIAAGACAVFGLANFHTHFMLSWLVPLSVAAGLYFDRARVGPLVGICVIAFPLVMAGPQLDRARMSRATFDEAATLIQPLLGGGCLFAFEAPPMLYQATQSCLPTSRLFPEHLNNGQEARATGLDATVEVRRILASRPSVIAMSRTSGVFDPNVSTRGLISAAVGADYRRVGTFRFYEVSHWQDVDVYALKDVQ